MKQMGSFVGVAAVMALLGAGSAFAQEQREDKGRRDWAGGEEAFRMFGGAAREVLGGRGREASESAMTAEGGKLYIVSRATLARVDVKTFKVEARAGLEEAGQNPEEAKKQREAWIARFDQNGDGVLTEADERAWRWVGRLDRNGDGKVGPEEAQIPPGPAASGPAILQVADDYLVMLRSGMLFKFELKTLKLVASERIALHEPVPEVRPMRWGRGPQPERENPPPRPENPKGDDF